MTTDSHITKALEKYATRVLLGSRWRRAGSWVFRNKRHRATVAAIKARALHKDVLVASVRLWLSEANRQSGLPS